MANIQIAITSNGTKTLATAGKYCDRNIDVNVNVGNDAIVFGTMNGSNKVTLTGTLADGTYTFEYKDKDGNVATIGSAFIGARYTNLLALATDASGAIFNDTGYRVGYKVSSYSGDMSRDQTDSSGCFVTGFMPYTVAQSKSKVPIYIKGISLDTSAIPAYMRFSHCIPGNADWYGVCAIATAAANDNFTITKLGENYYKFTPNGGLSAYNGWYGKNLTHMRWSLPGNGAGVIITVDEPIE